MFPETRKTNNHDDQKIFFSDLHQIIYISELLVFLDFLPLLGPKRAQIPLISLIICNLDPKKFSRLILIYNAACKSTSGQTNTFLEKVAHQAIQTDRHGVTIYRSN